MVPSSSFPFNVVSIKFTMAILQIPREMQFYFFPLMNIMVTALIITSISSIINNQIRHEVILNLREGINIFIMYFSHQLLFCFIGLYQTLVSVLIMETLYHFCPSIKYSFPIPFVLYPFPSLFFFFFCIQAFPFSLSVLFYFSLKLD